MGSILINYPNISDADLVFNESETKQILCFFFPLLCSNINSSTMHNGFRKLAQTMLVAAVDGSHQMRYANAIFTSLGPNKSVGQWAKKLGKGLGKAWFKNMNEKDLLKAEIYDSVRVTVAARCRLLVDELLSGIAFRKTHNLSFALNTVNLFSPALRRC